MNKTFLCVCLYDVLQTGCGANPSSIGQVCGYRQSMGCMIDGDSLMESG
jgi:hypothetical protein